MTEVDRSLDLPGQEETTAVAVAQPSTRPQVIPPEETGPRVGDWFWVTPDDTAKEPWLGCVVRVGSNYAKLEGVGERSWTRRVHFEEWGETCAPEPNADRIIAGRVALHRAEANRLMSEVKTLTGRLSIGTAGALSSGPSAETSALALRRVGQPMSEYKEALVLAQKETLPGLFRAIEAENKEMGAWMSASLIPLRAQADDLKPAIKAIEQRIFNVELYAGLVERVEQVADGEPAPLATPVHLMQRRAYMDEECLARYRVGGMAFAHLPDFDRWMAEPENRDRILPFPRCVVAFRVRRNLRDVDSPSLRRYIQLMEERELDKLTFLYVRNGDQLFRLNTGIEFGETLFPDLSQVDLGGQQLYARIFAGRVDSDRGLISKGEYDARVSLEDAARERAAKAPKEERWRLSPHTDTRREYVPFTPETVYYDDISAHVQGEIERHNRLVLVLQGLLDRSPVLHPHPPWQLWSQEGFEAALRLVYDESRALTPGDAPDFEAYRSRLNSSIGAGSVTVGQQDAWEELMAERENRRLDNDWREKSDYRHRRFQPYGDPGPGVLARVQRWGVRSGKATYEWDRVRRSEAWRGRFGAGISARDLIPTTVTVESSRLLNASAYTPGDFRIFFDDPRTRADYLRWAPLLLEAEEWHAGNRQVGRTEA